MLCSVLRSAAVSASRRQLPAALVGGARGFAWTATARADGAEADAAADEGSETELALTLASPHETMFKGAAASVGVTGADGEMVILPQHQSIISELAPGLVSIHKDEAGGEKEEFFASGGWLIHENSKTDITVAEGVRLEDVDHEELKKQFAAAAAAHASAAEGSKEKALAEIDLDTYQALGDAAGVSL